MPKLKERPEEKQDRLFKALVAKNMTLCGYEYNTELAIKLRMGRKTLGQKLASPDRFTRKELRRLFDLLEFSEDEKGAIM